VSDLKRRSSLNPITRSTQYDDLPEWLTLEEAAVLLNVSYWTIQNGTKKGTIPCRRHGRKVVLVPKRFFDPALAQPRMPEA
jgi:excisionase family DNA binding protein